MGLKTNVTGGSVGLRPDVTTLETTTYNLPAGISAKITAKKFKVPLVVDGVEIFPKYSATLEEFATTSTSDVIWYTSPEDAEVRGNFEIKASGGTTVVTIKDSFGTTVGTFSSGNGAYQTDVAIKDVLLKSGYTVNLRIDAGTATLRSTLVAESKRDIESVDVHGGASGITITGDEFIVTTYKVLNSVSSVLVESKQLESTTVETTTFNLPAGKTARLIPKRTRLALVADGEELMPQLERKNVGGVIGTTYSVIAECPVGYELRAYFSMAGNGAGGGAIVRVRDDHDAMVTEITFSQTIGTSPVTQTIIFTDRIITGGEWIEHSGTIAGHGTNYNCHVIPTVESMREREFWVYGGASGITITGDEFIVEIYG